MNGIEKITQRIIDDTEREIADIQARAKEQAETIAADFEARARKESEDILERGRTAAAEREANMASMDQMEAKKALLAAKQKMLARAFDLATEQLRALPEERYVKLLAALAANASASGKEEIILSKKDRESVGEAIVAAANKLLDKKGKLTLSDKTRPIQGGLVISDGTMEVNCSFETLVRLQENEMAGELANVLFQ